MRSLAYLIGEKKPELILVGKKISQLYKIGHFSLTKFYISQVIQKALSIPLKFYFQNRKLINGQVNWFIKINVSVEALFFFFTATVSLTDRFWLINRRFDWSAAVDFPFLTTLSYPMPPSQIMV